MAVRDQRRGEIVHAAASPRGGFWADVRDLPRAGQQFLLNIWASMF
jgi:hypothetical protein